MEEEPINIDNGKFFLIITASCRTVRMLFLDNSPYSTEQFAVQRNDSQKSRDLCKKAAQHFHGAVSKVFDRVKSVALWSANIRKLAKDHKGYGSAAT
jgi:hypothetical protein